jgi:hypothetical protein
MGKENWIWMPHAAHFICSRHCRFFLATKVGKYIVSTIGEYVPDSKVREIFAKSRGKEIKGKGDEWDWNYMKEFGFEDIGAGRKYETMVFKAKKSDGFCCPYIIENGEDIDFAGYNDPKEAYDGHLTMCKKWSHPSGKKTNMENLNRLIKFRAWDGKKMDYNPEQCTDGPESTGLNSNITGMFEEWHSPRYIAIMQYTGLRDKNGNEIYECDVVTDSHGEHYQVQFSDGAFEVIHDGNVVEPLGELADITEVIGNIYENPELIK